MDRLILAMAGAFLGILVAGVAYRNYKTRRHVGVTEEEFLSYFLTQGIPEQVSRAVYKHFQEATGMRNFRPAPSVELETTYGSDACGIEKDIPAMLQTLGYETPHSGIRLLWETLVVTIEDLVHWIDWVRRGSRR